MYLLKLQFLFSLEKYPEVGLLDHVVGLVFFVVVVCLFFTYIFVFVMSLVAHLMKNLPAVQKTSVQSLGWEDPREKGMATHFSILAWKIS